VNSDALPWQLRPGIAVSADGMAMVDSAMFSRRSTLSQSVRWTPATLIPHFHTTTRG
jgi:hypothetical protein